MEKKQKISNIRKKDLLKSPWNYLWLEIESDSYSNVRFAELLEFIDKYYVYGKKYPYGNAYYVIRKKANELYGIRRYAPVKLRISKHEVRAILHSVETAIMRRKYLKIPYKVSYIFKAIVLLVEEIEKNNNIKLPEELGFTMGLTYGTAFFDKYIDIYDGYYDRFQNRYFDGNIGYKLKMALYDDFHSDGSVFKIYVK
ncbi:hypothetical protein [Butyribacter intestini]|uniref:hypothetical protein n=1 Tax=Butyribacter intestini TaxID=1703332 RepID=UPI003AF1DD47|nr:hypothetical protein [Clostridium sp.]